MNKTGQSSKIEKPKKNIEDAKTIPVLVTELQKYTPYQNLSKYYIDKELSKKYDVRSVKKLHYINALNDVKHQKEPKSKKELFILDDINIQFMLNLTYPDLLVYCQTDKHIHNLCQKNDLWNKLIARDFPFYPDDEPKAQKSYEHWYKFFDKYTLDIIAAFITYRKKYIDLQKSYNEIFSILVRYIEENNISMGMDKDGHEYIKNVEQKLYKEIFDSLGVSIKIEKNFSSMTPDDKTMYRNLSHIIYEMMMTYDDPQ